MAHVVTEPCILCKYTDCVDVCPVDCFREGPNFLVIDPDECIGTLRQYAFDAVFREFAFWECEQIGDCLLCRLDSEISAGPVQQEPKADLEAAASAADANRPSKRCFTSKLKEAPK